MTLNETFNRFGSDKGNSVGASHNYAPIYEKWFDAHKNDKVTFMEVGIDYGQSAGAWHDYFANGQIFMVDYRDFSSYNKDRLQCFTANQSNFSDMLTVANKVNDLDFFVDDGGHCMDHQQLTFGALFPKMKIGGLFFIEDTHTSNWNPLTQPEGSPGYCYGQPVRINADSSNTTIQVFKDFQLTGKFKSEFLPESLCESLTSMIQEVIIYDDNNEEVGVNSTIKNIVKHGLILIKRKSAQPIEYGEILIKRNE